MKHAQRKSRFSPGTPVEITHDIRHIALGSTGTILNCTQSWMVLRLSSGEVAALLRSDWPKVRLLNHTPALPI